MPVSALPAMRAAIAYSAPAAAGLDLTGDLLAWWSMDADGSDSHGSRDLSANGTISDVSGIVSGGQGLATNAYYSITSASLGLDTRSSFTVAGWIKPGGVTPNNTATTILSKDSLSDPRFGFGHSRFGTNVFYFILKDGTETEITSLVTPTTGWHFVCAWLDSGTMYISVDGETPVSASAPTLTTANNINAQVGRLATIGSSASTLDEIAVWQRVLTDDERAWLYNSGAGRSYAESS